MQKERTQKCWTSARAAAFAVVAGAVVTSCYAPFEPTVTNPEVIEALQVVPMTSLDAAKNGRIDETNYFRNTSDPFTSDTYVLAGNAPFFVAAWNGAEKDALGLTDIENAQLVVSVKDRSKLESFSINGVSFDSGRFTFGIPSLPNGSEMSLGARFPADYAIAPIGTLRAKDAVNVMVGLKGACGLTVHLDIFGKGYCEKCLTNSPLSGTTLILNGSECDQPDCTKTPEDPRCKPDCINHPMDPRCFPDCTLTPFDVRCYPDCLKNPTDPRCKPDCVTDWTDPRCPLDCVTHPEDPRCPLDCVTNPMDPRCPLDCKTNPKDPRCPLDCVTNPTDPRCPLDCTATPTDPRCLPDCTATPLDPRCTPNCTLHPEDPRCHVNCFTNPTDPSCGCTRTIGYWKTHAGCVTPNASGVTTYSSCNQPDQVTKWLPIWLGTPNGALSFKVPTAQIAVNVLSQSVYGSPSNGITKLYAQLLAAKLNVKNGAASWTISSVIAEADIFLATHNFNSWATLSVADITRVNNWHTSLDNYNNGLLDTGHCN